MKTSISLIDIFHSIGPFKLKIIKCIDYFFGFLCVLLLPALPQKDLPQRVKRILIIRPGGIGDAVFLLPIINELYQSGLSIDILCEKRNVEVFLFQSKKINKVFLYDQNLFAVFTQEYDVVVDTEQWHYLSALISYFVKGFMHIGFNSRFLRNKLFNKSLPYAINNYELDNFTKLFNDFLEKKSSLNLEGCMSVDAMTQHWAEQKIQSPSIAIFLGASIALRRLKEEQIRDIVGHYQNTHQIIFLGGLDVKEFAHEVTVNLNNVRILNFTGLLTLKESIGLINQCTLMISPDSGLLHVACALGVPVQAIFGPGNIKKWGPQGEKHHCLSVHASCSPCTHFGYTIPTCKGAYHCMNTIKYEKI